MPFPLSLGGGAVTGLQVAVLFNEGVEGFDESVCVVRATSFQFDLTF